MYSRTKSTETKIKSSLVTKAVHHSTSVLSATQPDDFIEYDLTF